MSKKKTISKDNIKDVGLPIEPDIQDQEINGNEVKEDIQEQDIVEVNEGVIKYNDVKVQEELARHLDEEKPIVIEQTDEHFANVKSHKGIVINTSKLNVRKLPSLESEIVDVIKNKDTLTINPSKSTTTFYHVTLNNGLEGYCVRDYIVG